MMRRTLIIVVTAAAVALGGVWAASVVAPCALPHALTDKFAPAKSAACPASAQAATDQPRAVEPPAVTVVPAVTREFVDRLFVSGTLVAREEAHALCEQRPLEQDLPRSGRRGGQGGAGGRDCARSADQGAGRHARGERQAPRRGERRW